MTLPIPAMPPSPTRQDPVNFDSRGDAVMARLPSLVDDFNEAIISVNGSVVAAAFSETNAHDSMDAAALSASLASAGLNASLLGLATVHVATTSVNAAAGNLYSLENPAVSAVLLPAAPIDGQYLGIVASNGRLTNLVDPNGKTINLDGSVMTMDVPYLWLKYFGATAQWRAFV